MKKACLIGNSHFGCIRRAWETTQKSKYPNYSFEYFLSGSKWIRRLKVSSNAKVIELKSKTTERVKKIIETLKMTSGKEEIDINLKNYSLFFIGGLGFKDIFTKMKTYRDIRFDMSGAEHFISQEFFQELFTSFYQNHYAHRLVKNIRKQTKAKIILISEPCSTQYWLNLNKLDHFLHPNSDFISNLYNQYCALNKHLCSLNDAHFFTQPESTLDLPGFTMEHFNKNTIGFRGSFRKAVDKDGFHMNTEYGELLITELFSYLENL